MMIEEKRIITPESMVKYYMDLLPYTKSENHRQYINQMIGYFSGKIKVPDETTFFKDNEIITRE